MQVDQGTWPEFEDQDGMGSDTGGAEVVRRREGPSSKSLDSDEILKS